MGKREAGAVVPSNSSATRAMSLENVEIVRRALEAWNADLDALLAERAVLQGARPGAG